MPERMCVCCRNKLDKKDLFRLCFVSNQYILDEYQKIQARGFYICKSPLCIKTLSKHKKYKIEPELLITLLKKIKNVKKNIIDIIRPMKNSNNLVFGIDECIKGVKNNKVFLLIIPRNIKEFYIKQFEQLIQNMRCTIIYIDNQKSLFEIFNRDVQVIGITNKKVVNGILNMMEVTNEGIQIS